MQLSRHFTLQEMTFSQTAVRQGINNTPNEAQIQAIKALCENVLQKIRDHYDRPVIVSSGYRSPKLNVAVGSTSSLSQHLANNGAAADFTVSGIPTQQVFDDIRTGKIDGLVWDQCLLEFGQWIHCSYKSTNNRMQAMKVVKKSGKVVYVEV